MPQRPRQASASEDRRGCELAQNPDAGEGLLKSVQCTKEPMSDFIARSWYAYSSLLPTHLKIVCLFGLLGLALAAAVIPTIAPENFSWVLSHIKCDFIDGSSDSNSVILTKRPFRTRYRDGVLFAQPMSWPGVASPQHSKRHDPATMLKIAAITKTAAQLPVQVVNTLLAFAALIQHQQTSTL
jgi:hypothetical protein